MMKGIQCVIYIISSTLRAVHQHDVLNDSMKVALGFDFGNFNIPNNFSSAEIYKKMSKGHNKVMHVLMCSSCIQRLNVCILIYLLASWVIRYKFE